MMIQHEWHSETHPAERVTLLERELKIAQDTIHHLMLQNLTLQKIVATQNDEIEKLSLDLGLKK